MAALGRRLTHSTTPHQSFKELHLSVRGFKAEWIYRLIRENDPDAENLVLEAEREFADEIERDACNEEAALRRLRSRQKMASPILIGLCRTSGVDPATVAASVLPRSIPTHTSDGHPWLATGTPAHDELLSIEPKFELRVRNCAVVRAFSDPRGGMLVFQEGDTLDVSAKIGVARIETRAGAGEIRFAARLPETILAGAIGRPISAIIDHPLLADVGFRVTAARSILDVAIINFTCPSVPFEAATSGDFGGPPYLHSDPLLAGEEATEDIVRRMRMARGRLLTCSPAVELMTAGVRIHRINLSRPPEHRLPPPTAAMFERLATV